MNKILETGGRKKFIRKYRACGYEWKRLYFFKR
ncbi:hypothetical protein PSAG_04855 [Fusobacterium animalis D11]|uniref:Uncharacterized protein n=1 Tax=Fusobacterium animalis D11 TaxID=556264 RepID=A0A0K9CMI6_9FUSO|nr:hypothetical protein PSAG_04855 [Fusobacterium animalis D11]